MLHIKKKDKVMVISGDEKGKTGEVLKIFPDKGRLIISKVNLVKRHTKSSQSQPGGVIEKENSVHLSNVILVCSKCSNPTKVKMDKLADGKKVRICKKCQEIIL